MTKINGADKVAKTSQRIKQGDWGSWETIYYDMNTNTVMMFPDYMRLADKSRAYKVCKLIRPNTEEEVVEAVRQWLRF